MARSYAILFPNFPTLRILTFVYISKIQTIVSKLLGNPAIVVNYAIPNTQISPGNNSAGSPNYLFSLTLYIPPTNFTFRSNMAFSWVRNQYGETQPYDTFLTLNELCYKRTIGTSRPRCGLGLDIASGCPPGWNTRE